MPASLANEHNEDGAEYGIAESASVTGSTTQNVNWRRGRAIRILPTEDERPNQTGLARTLWERTDYPRVREILDTYDISVQDSSRQIGYSEDALTDALMARRRLSRDFIPSRLTYTNRLLSEKFSRLRTKWQKDTIMLSSVSEIAMNDAYQQIIGLGPVAIPLILEELKRSPEHWFWALGAITGEDPVPAEARGNIKEMAKAWFEWGRRNYYV